MFHYKNSFLGWYLFFVVSFPIFGNSAPLHLSYPEILRIAEKNSFDLKNLSFNKELDAGYALHSLIQFFPEIELGFSDNCSVAINAPDMRSKRISTQVKIKLFDGGRRFRSREFMLLERSMQRQTYLGIIEALEIIILKVYCRILILEKQIELLRKGLMLTEKNRSLAEKEFALGEITEIEYIETLHAYKTLKLDVRSAEHRKEQLLFQLKELCLIEPKTPLLLQGSINQEYSGTEVLTTPEECFLQGSKHNNELQSLRLILKRNEVQLKSFTCPVLPSLEASASYILTGSTYPLKNDAFSFSFIFSFPDTMCPAEGILSGGTSGRDTTRRNISLTTGIGNDLTSLLSKNEKFLEIRKNRFDVKNAEDQLRFSIDQWFKNHALKKDSLCLSGETLRLLRKKRLLMEKRFSLGEIRSIDLLESVLDEMSGEKSLLESVFSLFEEELKLPELTGMSLNTYFELEDIIYEK